MAHLPYADLREPEAAALVDRIVAERGSVLHLYQMLLHAPPLAETWLDHVGAVRWKTRLSGRLREIVIIRIAHLNRIDYVLDQHVPKLALADGVSLEECAALADWEKSNLFSPAERAALGLADAMTLDVAVPDEVFAPVKRHYGERELVELTVLIGTYLMHNRVMQALGIDLEET
jgi:alkylhydroperoxidase family enzyme